MRIYVECTLPQEYLHDYMKDGIPPSVTTDVWSNNQQDSFVGFELHFVDRAFKVVRKTMGTVPFLATHHTAAEIRKLVNSIAHDSLGVPVDSPVCKAVHIVWVSCWSGGAYPVEGMCTASEIELSFPAASTNCEHHRPYPHRQVS